MEDIVQAIEKTCIVESENDYISRRKTQYKSNELVDKIDANKEKRRLELIEEFKRKRDTVINEKRGLLDDEFNDNADWMDWEETKKNHRRKRAWINQHCKDQLMLSEWLSDRPSDLETNWTCVVCPEGRRTLVVARKGCTKAYHKSGYLLAKFKSILPNGAPSNITRMKDKIILDCIWKEKTNQLFALDVIKWNYQTLIDSDAQFRLYWLKSKLTENRQSNALMEGMYDVFLPEHCTLHTLSATLSAQNPNEVDGILFFHNSFPYVSGQTPLVGWLKPYMLPERLGVPVSQAYLDQRPREYVNLEQWIATVSHAHKRKNQRGLESPSTTAKDLEVSVCEMEEDGEKKPVTVEEENQNACS